MLKLSEDWQSTLIGLFFVVIIALGFFGPGPQRATLNAEPGETVSVDTLATDGWTVSATLGEDALTADSLVESLEDGAVIIATCEGGSLSTTEAEQLPGDDDAIIEDGEARLVLVNNCDDAVTVSYRIDRFVPWPLFGIFE